MSALRDFAAAWHRFWFETADTRPLELLRIGVGLTLLLSYLSVAQNVGAFYTEEGWMPLAQTPSIEEEWSTLSVLFLARTPEAAWALYVATLAAAVAYVLGWRSNVAKVVLFVGHYSFTRRAPAVAYGVDDLCSNLLFLQLFVPMGLAFSLDARRRASQACAPWRTTSRSMALRLSQVQMAVIMGFAGLEKLQGEDWWDGMGIWFAMTDWEFNFFPLAPFAAAPYLLNVLSYGSVLFELAYPALIWGRRTRTPLLLVAFALHLGVAVVMGLWLFSLAMVIAHLAFAPAAWLDRLGPADCAAPPQNSKAGSTPASSRRSTDIEGQRDGGSTDMPRASAR
ncbi:MAG: HTTM domain-containing protein [Myxococcota bacterium]